MTTRRRSWAWVLVLAALTGCGQPSVPPSPDTGARQAVHDYFDGLVRQDWRQSYDALHPDSRKRLTAEQFARLAAVYRRNLGFDPQEVVVQSCDERDMEAVAHVVLTGHTGSQARRHKDAVVLRRSAEGWRVILPDTFGRSLR